MTNEKCQMRYRKYSQYGRSLVDIAKTDRGEIPVQLSKKGRRSPTSVRPFLCDDPNFQVIFPRAGDAVSFCERRAGHAENLEYHRASPFGPAAAPALRCRFRVDRP